MPKSIFNYPEDFYYPTPELGFELYVTEKEAKKEFRRLRDIAHKREQRLKKEGFVKNQTYKELEKLSKLTVKNIQSKDELALWLGKLESMLKKEETTVKGMREKRKKREKEVQETLLSHGYDIDDIDDFGEFMEAFRAYYGKYILPSDSPAELYEILEGHEFNPNEIMDYFEYFTHDIDETARIVKEYDENKKDTEGLDFTDYLLDRLGEL